MHYAALLASGLAPARSYEEALRQPGTGAVGAFCEWACHFDGDAEAALRTNRTHFKLDADPESLHQQTVELLSHLSFLSGRASEDADLRTALSELYPVFVQAVEAERQRVTELYAGERPPAPAPRRSWDTPQIELAFAYGHGAYNANSRTTVVPQGMTLHFVAHFDEYALTTNTLTVIAQGGSAGSVQRYEAGETVPNYNVYPPQSDLHAALPVLANVRDFPLYLIGDREWDLGAPMSALCTDPDICETYVLQGRHACDGLLATLGHVRNLYVLTCRARSDIPETPGTTYRVPGESVPIAFFCDVLDVVRSPFTDESDVVEELQALEREDPARMARILLNPVIRRKLLVRQCSEFLQREGRIAYLGMYLNLTAQEQQQLDRVGRLRAARESAQVSVDAFIHAPARARAPLLQELLSEARSPEGRNVVTEFLGYRVPGFRTWRNNPADFDEIAAGARAPIEDGGTYTGLYNPRLETLLVSDANGWFNAYPKGLVAEVRLDGIRVRIDLEPAPRYRAAASIGRGRAPQRVQETLQELIRAVRGPDTLFHTAL